MNNPFSRRGILGLFVGAGASAVTQPRLTLAKASEGLGLPVGSSIVDVTETFSPVLGCSNDGDIWPLINLIEDDRHNRRVRSEEMPPHISSKKSWSPAFKSHVYAGEQRILNAYLQQLRTDQNTRSKVLSLFGIQLNQDKSRSE